MPFLSTLLNVGKGLIGLGGGNSGDIAKKVATALGSVAPVVGGAAKGAYDSRQADIDAAIRRQQLLQDVASNTANDAFRRGQYQGDDTYRRALFGHAQQEDLLKRPSLFGKQALAGGLMQGLQDVNIGRPEGSTIPTFAVSGGLRPSAMGQNAREAGGEMSRVALMNMLSGGPAPIALGPQADLGPGYQAPPDLQLPRQGTGEKLLGGLALGGGLLGGLFTKQPVPTDVNTQRVIQPWDKPDLSGMPINRTSMINPMPTLDDALPQVASKRPYRGLFGGSA